MNFQDGDKIRSTLNGEVWTRKDKWWSCPTSVTGEKVDHIMQYLLDLTVPGKVASTKAGKNSKPAKEQPLFIYIPKDSNG